MTSARLKELEKSISTEVSPVLRQEGFVFDRRMRTFRRQVGSCFQIINFQLGTRSMEGHFTVNLGIYHPVYREDPNSECPEFPEESHCLIRERLSLLRDTTLTKIFRHKFKQVDSFLKWWLTTPTDVWWKFSEAPGQTRNSMAAVLTLLQARGLPWLEAACSVEKLRTIHGEHQRRRGKI